MSQHTPGPWGKFSSCVIDECGELVASLEEREDDGGNLTDCANADACLIAAAPDLLAALNEQVEAMNNSPMGDLNYAGIDWLKRARAALAKAKGEQG